MTFILPPTRRRPTGTHCRSCRSPAFPAAFSPPLLFWTLPAGWFMIAFFLLQHWRAWFSSGCANRWEAVLAVYSLLPATAPIAFLIDYAAHLPRRHFCARCYRCHAHAATSSHYVHRLQRRTCSTQPPLLYTTTLAVPCAGQRVVRARDGRASGRVGGKPDKQAQAGGRRADMDVAAILPCDACHRLPLTTYLTPLLAST